MDFTKIDFYKIKFVAEDFVVVEKKIFEYNPVLSK